MTDGSSFTYISLLNPVFQLIRLKKVYLIMIGDFLKVMIVNKITYLVHDDFSLACRQKYGKN